MKPILERSRRDFVDVLPILQQARSRGELPRYLEAPLSDLVKKLGINP